MKVQCTNPQISPGPSFPKMKTQNKELYDPENATKIFSNVQASQALLALPSPLSRSGSCLSFRSDSPAYPCTPTPTVHALSLLLGPQLQPAPRLIGA